MGHVRDPVCDLLGRRRLLDGLRLQEPGPGDDRQHHRRGVVRGGHVLLYLRQARARGLIKVLWEPWEGAGFRWNHGSVGTKTRHADRGDFRDLTMGPLFGSMETLAQAWFDGITW